MSLCTVLAGSNSPRFLMMDLAAWLAKEVSTRPSTPLSVPDFIPKKLQTLARKRRAVLLPPPPFDFTVSEKEEDPLYTIARLCVLLQQEEKGKEANILLNHYLACTGDWKGAPLLRPYQQHISAQIAPELTPLYISRPPFAAAFGGLSGSGKSRLSRESAPFVGAPPGAVILRDDIIRKQLCGLGPEDALPETAYTDALEKGVWRTLFRLARELLDKGIPVFADGIFDNEDNRRQIAAVAKETGVPFVGFWVSAPFEERKKRVMERLRNPSDMNPAWLKRQLHVKTGRITWHKINSARPRDETTAEAIRVIKEKQT